MRAIGAPTDWFRPLHDGSAARLLILILGAGACAAPPDERVREEDQAYSSPPVSTPHGPSINIDISRSLAVTDLPTLEAKDDHGHKRFSLERVLGFIANSSGAALDAAGLYQRIFDTNNLKANAIVADGQHCDDTKDANGQPVLNGFPVECPRQEGKLADLTIHNPFCSGANCDPYTPVAITSRFDLAPADGANCGQYRIVFAKGFQQEPLTTAGNPLVFNRVLMIFEAIVPNPKPNRGLAGCKKVVKYWADLSKEDNPRKRAKALDAFFFGGADDLGAALDWSHFTGAVDPVSGDQMSGQIRANQFLNDPATGGGGQMWQLREYHLARSCTGSGYRRNCQLKVRMDPTLVNPPSGLFDERNKTPLALSFRDPTRQDGFIAQVPKLAAGDLNLIDLSGLSRVYNGGQSTSSPAFIPGTPPADDANYNAMFDPTGPFAANIQAALDKMQSPLTPSEIVRRAQTQACAGCHELATSTASFFGGQPDSNQLGGGLVWPDAALGPEVPGFGRIAAFTQISDSLLVPLASGVTCDTTCTAHPESCQCAWAVSRALSTAFLPFRQKGMSDFLSSLNRRGRGCDNDDD